MCLNFLAKLQDSVRMQKDLPRNTLYLKLSPNKSQKGKRSQIAGYHRRDTFRYNQNIIDRHIDFYLDF